jgi:ABC-type transport system substrate-binding protein
LSCSGEEVAGGPRAQGIARSGDRRAQARGGLAAAAAFLERSVALTADPARLTERILAAAMASMQAGAYGKALDLLATTEAGPLDELQSARVYLLRGQVAFASGRGGDAAPLQTTHAATGTGSWNAAHFNDTQYETLSRQYIAAVDLSTQRSLAGQIQTLLLDQTPIIYGYFYDHLTATAANVAGVYPIAIGGLFLHNVVKT